jgi:hypothetical protein
MRVVDAGNYHAACKIDATRMSIRQSDDFTRGYYRRNSIAGNRRCLDESADRVGRKHLAVRHNEMRMR